jgi:serine/threonine protein phosphatase PrpC
VVPRASNPEIGRDVVDEALSTPAPSGEILVHVFGRTDVGRTREHNEDAFVVADLTSGNATLQPEVRSHVVGPRGTLFMVADGMGGAAAGEIASAMAVEVVVRDLQMRWGQAGSSDPSLFVSAIRAATEHANARIHRYASEHREYRGMGTTATVAGILGDTLYLGQVGDSRAYLVRNGIARQITKDQSLMQRLVEAGEITAEEAEVSDRRNIILQALGPEPSIRVDLTHQQVRRGDVLILCSDGLSGLVRADEIARAVAEEPDLVVLCKRLIDTANSAGGPDNITVIAARFDGEGLLASSDGDEIGHRVFSIPGEPPPEPEPHYFGRSSSDAARRPTVPVEVPAEALAEARAEARAASQRVTPPSVEPPAHPRDPQSVRKAYTAVAVLGALLLVSFAVYYLFLAQ